MGVFVARATIVGMARPFVIKVEPPPPLTADEAAQKYGVSPTKSKSLKAFAVGSVAGRSQLRLAAGPSSGSRKGGVTATARRTESRAASASRFQIRRKSTKSSRSTAAKKK
jgi:hypothetical protein